MPESKATGSAEWQFLCAACSSGIAESTSTLLPPSDSIQWNALFSLAERHGVLPLLCQTLANSPSKIPAHALSVLKQRYQVNLHKTLFLSRELIHIVDSLSERGIGVMPYKGLTLAESVYGDVALRQAGDIDLLIRPQDFPAIRKALCEIGYSPHVQFAERHEKYYLRSGYECAFDGAAGPNLLELQWAIQPKFYAVDLEMDGLFRRAQILNFAGRSMKVLSFEDLLIVLCLHAAKHAWGRLIWLCDIARTAQRPEIDWRMVASQADSLGITRILRVSLVLSELILYTKVPSLADTTLPHDIKTAELAREIAPLLAIENRSDVESAAYFRLMLRLRERISDRLRFLARLVLTPGPGEWNALQLPEPLFPMYRLVRLSRLAARLVKA
jgi:hypothetical protein